MTTTIRNNRAPQILAAIQRGTRRALTRSMQTGRTHAVRAVAAEVGATQTVVRKRLILEKPVENSIALRFTGKRLRVIDVRVQQRGRVPGSFRATVGVGRHKGIFVRKEPSLSRKGRGLPRSSPQLRIRELYAVSVPFVAIKNQILESTLEAASAAFHKNAPHEIRRAVSGAN